MTRVPRTPPFVEGVTNLRGRVVPVLDLRRRLGLGVGPRDRRTRIVIVEGEGGTVGVVVDAVTEVRAVPRSAVQPPSPYVARGIDAVRGIAELGDRLLVLLDLARILDAGEEPAEAAGGEGPDLAEVS
jgi:purine-binding chemotaxis protein CheW